MAINQCHFYDGCGTIFFGRRQIARGVGVFFEQEAKITELLYVVPTNVQQKRGLVQLRPLKTNEVWPQGSLGAELVNFLILLQK